jgi:predicted NBD/HSP70 family sugar kinase
MSQPDQGSVTAGAQGMLRALNARAVLEVIDRYGPVARADLARLTGLSKPTVTLALSTLLAVGTVREAGVVSGRKGPAAVLYALDAALAWGVAVDLGHDRIRVAVADLTGTVRARRDSAVDRDAERLVAQTTQLCADACAEAGTGLSAPTRVVIGLPAVVGPDGRTLSYADGLPDGGLGLGQALASALPGPVVLENDVNLAALAERDRGQAADLDDFVLVSLGVGLGLGIVVGGRLHRGASGAAGEAGYLPGSRDQALHTRPPLRRDLVDASIGARHIVSRARALGLGLGDDLSARDVFDHARTGNPAALTVVDETAAAIAYVIACVAPLLDPQAVVLGGAVGSNPDLLLAPVRAHLESLSPFRPEIRASSLGSEAVLIGATARAVALARAGAFDSAAPV